MIALCWIKNNKEWKVWVQNRVDIITKIVKPDNWDYISSSDIPAILLPGSVYQIRLLTINCGGLDLNFKKTRVMARG